MTYKQKHDSILIVATGYDPVKINRKEKMVALGLSSKKKAKGDLKSHKSKSNDDAASYLAQLEKKKHEDPNACVFC